MIDSRKLQHELNKLELASHELGLLAHAFLTTGNTSMFECLLSVRDVIDTSTENIKKLNDASLNIALKEAQATMGRMLSVAAKVVEDKT